MVRAFFHLIDTFRVASYESADVPIKTSGRPDYTAIFAANLGDLRHVRAVYRRALRDVKSVFFHSFLST